MVVPAVLAGRVHDGAVAVAGDGDDGEGGHQDVDGGQGRDDPTHGSAQHPALQRVLDQREGHAHAAHEDVTDGQVEDVEVPGRPKVLPTQHHHHYQDVAHQAQGDDQAVGDDQSHHRLRGEPVRLVLVLLCDAGEQQGFVGGQTAAVIVGRLSG